MRSRQSLATALLVTPLLLTACSGGATTASDDAGSTPATSSSAPPASPSPASSSSVTPPPRTSPEPAPTGTSEEPATTPPSTAGSGSAGDEDGTAAGAGEGSSGPGGARCTTEDLDVAVGGGSGGAAGSVLTAVLFANTGTTSCTLRGYPGVSFAAGEDGEQVGAAAERDDSSEVAEVELEPGDEASAVLRVVQHGAFPEDRCDPTDARGYRIYPPGETAAAFVAAEQTACGADDAALLTVGPVMAGPPQD